MQFLVIGRDGTDPDAPKRRAGARTAHLALTERKKAEGHHLYAAAILDDAGGMVGSAMVVQCKDREALDKWLEEEPYVKEGVWKDIEVTPCSVPPIFQTKK